jgi:hypothetical protein
MVGAAWALDRRGKGDKEELLLPPGFRVLRERWVTVRPTLGE